MAADLVTYAERSIQNRRKYLWRRRCVYFDTF